MEKSSKKETKKVTAKVTKKETTTKKKVSKQVFNNETTKSVKMVAWILTFIATFLCIFTFVFSIIVSLNVFNTTKLELLHNNFSVTFISNINGITISEAENLIEGYGNKTIFVIFDIIIPTIAIISMAILLVFLLKKILDFVSTSSKEKDLYTPKKLHTVEVMACLADAIVTISFVVFKRPSLLLYLFISLLLFVIIGLFKKCVEDKNSQ